MDTTPRADLARFFANRFGMFIHWGLYAMVGRGEWLRNEWSMPNTEFATYLANFNPTHFDPRAWARAAREAGMRYVVVTAKHHEGFCLWDSAHTECKATRTPFGRDALREVVDAFRAEDLRIGLYYSLLDWQHEHYTIDRFHPLRAHPDREALNRGRDLRRYVDYVHAQVRELLSGYGDIDILWFDFSFEATAGDPAKGRAEWRSEELAAMIRQLQPGIIINNRFDLPEQADIETPEQYTLEEPLRDADGRLLPWEGCHSLCAAWCYHQADDEHWKSARQCLNLLIDNVCANGNLLMNVGPTSLGELDARTLARLGAYADWMRHHAAAIHACGCAPDGIPEPRDCRYTYNAQTRRLYVHIMNWPFRFLTLRGLSGRVAYAQMLNDGCQVKFHDADRIEAHPHLRKRTPAGSVVLELPVQQPPVAVPVIELRLKD